MFKKLIVWKAKVKQDSQVTHAETKLKEQVKVTSVTDEHKRKGFFFFKEKRNTS